jgi:hypothetical protein
MEGSLGQGSLIPPGDCFVVSLLCQGDQDNLVGHEPFGDLLAKGGLGRRIGGDWSLFLALDHDGKPSFTLVEGERYYSWPIGRVSLRQAQSSGLSAQAP